MIAAESEDFDLSTAGIPVALDRAMPVPRLRELMRAHKLEAFRRADALVVDIYRATARMPLEERYGLQTQLRRTAFSVPNYIVVGCSVGTTAGYRRGLALASASAQKLQYLLDLAVRLGFVENHAGAVLADACTDLVRSLDRLRAGRGPTPSTA